MGEYVSDFGVVRYVGRGEGRDEKYDASAMPAEGTTNGIEVVVNENGPVPNKGTGYGNGQAKIPAGAVIGRSVLLVDKKGSAASIVLQLVKVDGTDAQAMNDAYTPLADGEVLNANELNGVRIAEDRFVKATGTLTGFEGKLIIEYV